MKGFCMMSFKNALNYFYLNNTKKILVYLQSLYEKISNYHHFTFFLFYIFFLSFCMKYL